MKLFGIKITPKLLGKVVVAAVPLVAAARAEIKAEKQRQRERAR